MDLEKHHYFIRKLHSLSGILPVGIFLLEHLTINSLSMLGSDTYNKAIAILHSIPFLPVVEILLIAVPIAFHALYGLWIVYLAKNNALTYTYYRNWLFYLQRVTAVITFIYVLYHTYTLSISRVLFGLEISFNTMTTVLSNPWVLAFYIIGLVAAVYHFANGLATFLITWGVTVGPFSQKVATIISGIMFVVLSLMGIQSLFAFI
ncbi:MAG TPA: succinate dehydrogenase [Clostridia bacterium]|nr:succinate dehydrogenase [Clostridia bacterium]